MLVDIAKTIGTVDGFTGVQYDNGSLKKDSVPNIEGTIKLTYPIYQADLD
jgi:hypothetical protein